MRKVMALISVCALLLISCAESTQSSFIPVDYPEWTQTTDEILNYSIPGHGSGLRKIFINGLGLEYREELDNGRMTYNFPNGTLIVKEVYSSPNPADSDEPFQLTAMYKDPGHPLQRGGWLWIVKNMSNGSETILNEEFCFTCHNNANESFPYGDGNPFQAFQDFVFYLPSRADGLTTEGGT